MGNLSSLSINKNDYNNRNKEKANHRDDYVNVRIQTMTRVDYLKLMASILLLTGSVIMYNYEPPPPPPPPPPIIITDTTSTNVVKTSEKAEVDDNPYGFHPFYQVHKRIQYKNPKTINPCDNIDPSKTLLLTILSRASNVHIREAIRQTWGAIRIYNNIEIRVTFIVAVDDGMIKQIELEQAIYHDVIEVNLPENYPVVSFKELAALCWSRYFCPDIQYVFKADEDIHLNTPLLTKVISQFMKNESLPNIPRIYGWFRHKSRVDRGGRYLVTEEEYPSFYYPAYTFGIGYLLTKAGRDNLCMSAQRPHPVTRVGDAYITGILRDHARVDHARFGDVHFIYSYTLNGPLCEEYFTYDPKLLVCMSSLHTGSNDVADEYVHIWDTIYQDNHEILDDEE